MLIKINGYHHWLHMLYYFYNYRTKTYHLFFYKHIYKKYKSLARTGTASVIYSNNIYTFL